MRRYVWRDCSTHNVTSTTAPMKVAITPRITNNTKVYVAMSTALYCIYIDYPRVEVMKRWRGYAC